MSRRCVFAITAAASFFVGGAGKARAQAAPPSAEKAQAIFDRAKAIVEAGGFEDACPLFAESYALDPQVGVLLNLAFCYEGAHRTASAWRIWLKAAEAADALGQTTRAAFARDRARQLEPRLPRVTVSVAPQASPAIVGVVIDRAPLDRERWDTPIALDEGEHEIAAGGSGLQRWSSRFVVAAGHVPAVMVPELAPLAPAPRMEHPAAPEGRGSLLRPIAWTVGGVGLAAVGVGAAFGVAGIAAKNASTRDGHCVDYAGSKNCNPTGANDVSLARRDMQIADVGYAIGGGLLLTGVVLWLVGRDVPESTKGAAGLVVQPGVARGSWSVAVDGAW